MNRRGYAIDLAFLVAAACLLGAVIVRAGFSHVSDDDYARVVIAELFAQSPKLDPSGTSWLPFPFWINGAAMIVFGRSLATARVVAFVLGALSVVPPYLALRAAGVKRPYAVVGVVIAMCAPWNAWLALSTVPEAMTASLVAAGAIAIGTPRARPWAAAGLFVAALSRYEAWPVCAAFAIVCAIGARKREHRRTDLVALVLAASGPILWMAWNAHAHGSALHFFARVASYRQTMGGAAVPASAKWLGYPRAFVRSAPAVAAFAAVGALGLGNRETRARWALPLTAAGAMLAFLVYGDLRDGAPTHHPERALIALTWILAAFGVDGARAFGHAIAWGHSKREMLIAGVVTTVAITWLSALPVLWQNYPGRDDADRETQLERGRALRDAGAQAIVVTPCAYEHFALLAAFGAPERAEVREATHDAPTAACPSVDVRW